MGLLLAITLPAGGALLSQLVPPSRLLRAHALVGTTAVVALALAATLGATLVSRYQSDLCIALSAGVLLAAAVITLLARPLRRDRAVGGGVGKARGLPAGFRYVRDHRRVVRLGGLILLEWSAAAAFLALLLPVGAGASGPQTTQGFAQFAAAASGMIVGALLSVAMGPGLRGPLTAACSLLGAGAAALLAALTTPGLPSAAGANLPAMASWALLGVFFATAVVGTRSALVRIIPGFVKGRLLGLLEATVAAGFIASMLGTSRLEHAAGGLSTGLVLTGAGLALLVAGACALTAELARSPLGRLNGFLYALNRFYCRWWFGLERQGPCRIPPRGPVIVAANHTATIDPLLLAACSPHRLIGFMTAAEYYHLPVLRHLFKRVGCIPVERTGRDAQSARAGLAHLQVGGALGIFPEGGIPKPGVRRGAKKGVGMLALRTGAAVVPVYISGTRWSPGVARAFFRRHHARVRFARPIDATARRSAEPVRQANQELADLILGEIRKMKPQDS
jgi:1-acyl-sn-glycerol-3-phosphate acyltransferase